MITSIPPTSAAETTAMSRSDRFFETLNQATRPGATTRPRLFGILNLTPDSFSDGGAHTASPEVSIDFAVQMVADGADALDLGAESTRPGSGAVPAAEEIRRLLTALKLIRARFPDHLVVFLGDVIQVFRGGPLIALFHGVSRLYDFR